MNSKWIRDLKVQAKAMKLSAENIGIILQDCGFGHEFLDTKPKHEQQKKKTDPFDFIKNLSCILSCEEGTQKNGENICKSYI